MKTKEKKENNDSEGWQRNKMKPNYRAGFAELDEVGEAADGFLEANPVLFHGSMNELIQVILRVRKQTFLRRLLFPAWRLRSRSGGFGSIHCRRQTLIGDWFGDRERRGKCLLVERRAGERMSDDSLGETGRK
ncbi:hypothetical protein AXF42_Ash021257 [Apostasia shenzhenica]|uniref:Uncharacterized protein n=1 Tax=Apostasia shenzhenica TaxID=1088818 RepID=A0A2H9ZUD3_9ASPA|nr:hypothetical protein AXF42_Ash021257 [Apostasia shenzhenica]